MLGAKHYSEDGGAGQGGKLPVTVVALSRCVNQPTPSRPRRPHHNRWCQHGDMLGRYPADPIGPMVSSYTLKRLEAGVTHRTIQKELN